MICNDAFKLLTKLDENKGKSIVLNSPEQLTLQELEKNGYVSQVKLEDFDPYELSRAKSELAHSQNMEKKTREQLAELEIPGSIESFGLYDREKLERELESASLHQQGLRNQILTLSELSAKKERSISIYGIDYSITYKGKELMENFMPRIKRIGNKQLNEFEQEMSVLNNTFVSWAKRSFEILEYLSPRTLQIDEIHCRSVVIGLSSRPETVKDLSDAFGSVLESASKVMKNQDRLPSIAECIIINLKNLSKESVSSGVSKFYDLKVLAGKYASNDDTAIDCALLLYPFDHSTTDDQRFLGSALDFARIMDVDINFDVRLEAALLIEVMGLELNEEIARKFKAYYDKINIPEITDKNTGIAAALIVIGIFEGQPIYSRFTAALDYLNRFSEEPMIIPAAMLSHLSPEIGETLDTLRLSSSAIARQKLSLGGMENLSLGMKMLLQSSVISSMISIPPELRKQYVFPQEMIPLQTLGILSLSMLPVALTAFTAFHELSIHKLSVSDYGFHPVHTNYAYG